MKYLNQKELAAVLGLSTRQVRALTKKGLPVEVDEKRKSVAHPCPLALAWYFERKHAAERAPESLRDRLTRARAEKIELQNAVERGELIRIEDAVADVDKALHAMRGILAKIPTTFTSRLQDEGLSRAKAAAVLHEIRESIFADFRVIPEHLWDAGRAEGDGEE